MKKFDGILICTDLDGTLVRSDGTVSEADLKAIEYFKSEGGLFTFITARMLCHTAEVRAMIHANAPLGCLNGGALYDEEKEDFIWIHKIDASVFELARYVAEHTSEIGIALVGFRNVYFYGDTPAVTKYRTDRKLPDLKCTIGEVGEPICKLLLIAESNEKVFAAADILNNHPQAQNFDYLHSQPGVYEILPKGMNKGQIITALAEVLGSNIKKTVAVGDHRIDIPMLCAADVGIAVANAKDAAKAVADYVTVSNDEDPLSHIISDIENGLIKI
jgi:Cof subfamily protein (haloacid dehalogenase superfamily)